MKQEKLVGKAAVKGTMLKAHLSWAREHIGEDLSRLRTYLDPESFKFLTTPVLALSWIPLRCLVEIDKAIAGAVGGEPERVFEELGRHSARINLGGVYSLFVADEPHRFYGQMVIHNAFQNFGHLAYEKMSERSGRIKLSEYPEYSPVYCASALGFYEEALRMMKVPGPISVAETSCQCAGDKACCYDLSW